MLQSSAVVGIEQVHYLESGEMDPLNIVKLCINTVRMT